MLDIRIMLDASPSLLAVLERLTIELRDVRLLASRVAWNQAAAADRRDDRESVAVASEPAAVAVPSEPVAVAPPPPAMPAQERVWTAARLALLADMDGTDMPRALMLVRVNALPGPRVATVGALASRLKALRMARRKPVAKAAPVIAAPAPTPGPALTWTAERDARLLAMDGTGLSQAEMLATLNALPGAPIASVAGLATRLTGLRQRQRQAASRDTQASAAAPRAPVRPDREQLSVARLQLADDAAQASGAPVTLADACLWGERNKVPPLRGESDALRLARINHARGEAGLPPFVLIPARGPQTRLPHPDLVGAA